MNVQKWQNIYFYSQCGRERLVVVDTPLTSATAHGGLVAGRLSPDNKCCINTIITTSLQKTWQLISSTRPNIRQLGLSENCILDKPERSSRTLSDASHTRPEEEEAFSFSILHKVVCVAVFWFSILFSVYK